MKIILTEKQLLKLINENLQLADKVYFKTGILSDEDKKIILDITKGDNYTKMISDFYYHLKNEYFYEKDVIIEQLELLYNDVKNYNKNVFPIRGYDILNADKVRFLVESLRIRRNIIKQIKQLPSIAIRNMKEDIRTERKYRELFDYDSDLNHFMGYYYLLSNRDKETQLKFHRKMFRANTTLDDLMEFVDDKSNFIGGVDFTKDDLRNLISDHDLYVVYEKNNVMIVKVESPEAIKAIGCNSLWCFTYGSEFESASTDWYKYSYNGVVYVIIDFNEKSDSENFMHVLIKPLLVDGKFYEYEEDESPLFNMSNENYNNPYYILNYILGTNYKTIIKKYLNFNY